MPRANGANAVVPRLEILVFSHLGLSRYKWLVLANVSVGVFLWVSDQSGIIISLPSISSEFAAGLPSVQWVVLAYLLTVSALLMPMGRVADTLGRKRLYMMGFFIFASGALASSFAENLPWLLAARVVQAVGAASLQANGMAIAVSIFPPEERGRVFGFNAIVVAAGATAGPVYGGFLVDTFGWQSVLISSAALSMVTLMITSLVLDESRVASMSPVPGRLDWAGMVTSATATVLILVVLSRGHSQGWTSPIMLGASAVAVLAIAAFVVVERKAASPMIDLSLFLSRVFSFGSFAKYIAFIAVAGNTFMMPFYLQGAQGMGAGRAGLLLVPFAANVAIGGIIGGRTADWIGPRIPSIVGMVLACIGLIALSRLNQGSSLAYVGLATGALGMGMGLFGPANSTSIMGVVERARYGLVTAFINLVRNLGQVTGTAVATLVVTLAITGNGIEADIGILRDETAVASPLLVTSFMDGLRMSYVVGACLTAFAAFVSSIPPNPRIRQGSLTVSGKGFEGS